MVFLVVKYGFESWTIKKAKHQRIDPFELWCWRVLWTARRSDQSILKAISPEYSLEGLMLNSNILATWCEELTHLKRPWCWERLKAGGEGDDRGWDGWMASLTRRTWVWVSSSSWWWTGKPSVLQSMGRQSQTWLSDWTELLPLCLNEFVDSYFCSKLLQCLLHFSYYIFQGQSSPLAPSILFFGQVTGHVGS